MILFPGCKGSIKKTNRQIISLQFLSPEKANDYICTFQGFNVENIETLAACISEIGFNNQNDNSQKYLEKALQLYELCSVKSKTFSFEREGKISEIKNALENG